MVPLFVDHIFLSLSLSSSSEFSKFGIFQEQVVGDSNVNFLYLCMEKKIALETLQLENCSLEDLKHKIFHTSNKTDSTLRSHQFCVRYLEKDDRNCQYLEKQWHHFKIFDGGVKNERKYFVSLMFPLFVERGFLSLILFILRIFREVKGWREV